MADLMGGAERQNQDKAQGHSRSAPAHCSRRWWAMFRIEKVNKLW